MTVLSRRVNHSTATLVGRPLLASCLLAGLGVVSGCHPLRPSRIDASHRYDSLELIDDQPLIQRGSRRKILDGVGWVIGIPDKILLWNRRVDNHNISPETEQAVAQYLEANDLGKVRVRLNQYYPADDWRRLVRNKKMGAGWRYTFGALGVLEETLLPGRLFGGDHFNPYTNTIHIYSDVPAIALHEAAHAKDFARRKWKGTYAAIYALPIVPLYHESVATRDALAYIDTVGSIEERAAARKILYPAYGTYAGSAAGYAAPAVSTPIYFGALIGGHVVGRYEAHNIESQPTIPYEMQPLENLSEPYETIVPTAEPATVSEPSYWKAPQ